MINLLLNLANKCHAISIFKENKSKTKKKRQEENTALLKNKPFMLKNTFGYTKGH